MAINTLAVWLAEQPKPANLRFFHNDSSPPTHHAKSISRTKDRRRFPGVQSVDDPTNQHLHFDCPKCYPCGSE